MSYDSVMVRVAEAADRVGRDPAEVTVVAVSKGQPVDQIKALYQSGHRDFGENRAQELTSKAPDLPEDIRWHFVGQLQTNKVRVVRPVTILLHSMDRSSLALAWLKGSGLPPPVLVQVNLGGETQKSGVDEAEAVETVGMAVDLGLDVRGLMTVPPVPKTPEASRPLFRRLREIGSLVTSRWPEATTLSMGMTDDFEVAIEEGASIIRVGRAIFGDDETTGT